MMAVRQFEGQVKHMVPDDYQPSKADNSLPEGNLSLKHVFGYCCYDGYKGNVKQVKSDQIVMAAAGLGVTMNTTTGEQDFFKAHCEDVVSMAVHPDKHLVATG